MSAIAFLTGFHTLRRPSKGGSLDVKSQLSAQFALTEGGGGQKDGIFKKDDSRLPMVFSKQVHSMIHREEEGSCCPFQVD
jgi:hypothetical protein